jgi:glycosyltransferase involved in cell wall biosynthesis
MNHLPSLITQNIQTNPQIHCTGYVPKEQKVWLYQHASAVIIPSLSEGFGLPVLEALFYNKPLLLSNQAALPEIAGPTATYFNPFDICEIAETVQRHIRSNPCVNTTLYQNRLAQFSWRTTAHKIGQILTTL